MTNPSTDLPARIDNLRDELDLEDFRANLGFETDYERVLDIAIELGEAYMERAERDDDDNDGEEEWIRRETEWDEIVLETLAAMRANPAMVDEYTSQSKEGPHVIRPLVMPAYDLFVDGVGFAHDRWSALNLNIHYVTAEEPCGPLLCGEGDAVAWFSIDDLATGRAKTAPSDAYLEHAGVLSRAGIRDTRLWRHTFEDGIPAEYVIATFAEAA